MQFSDGTEYPLYMDKGNRIMIEGNAEKMDSLNITGHPLNEELTAFRQELAGLKTPTSQQITQMAGTYIENHLASLTSIYVLDKYFVQQASPDFRHIERLIENMTGELKDQSYIQENISQDTVKHIFTVGKEQAEKLSEAKRLRAAAVQQDAVVKKVAAEHTELLREFDRLKTAKARTIKDAANYSNAYNKGVSKIYHKP